MTLSGESVDRGARVWRLRLLGCGSRAAATAYAYEHELVGHGADAAG
jgi:hypothetical protein